MDNELFELCKEVYEKTAWEGTLEFYDAVDSKYVEIEVEGGWESEGSSYSFDSRHNIPLYTSDYLLEKLPRKIRHNGKRLAPQLRWVDEMKWWLAQYYEEKDGVPEYNAVGNTPLKALLKLTLALKEAKEI